MKSNRVRSGCRQEAMTYQNPATFQDPPLHDNTLLHVSPKLPYAQNAWIHILNIAAAEDVLPRSKNHGLNPSDDLASIIRTCWGGTSATVHYPCKTQAACSHLRKIRYDHSNANECTECRSGAVAVLWRRNEGTPLSQSNKRLTVEHGSNIMRENTDPSCGWLRLKDRR